MSSYVEQFKNQSFLADWGDIRVALDEIDSSDFATKVKSDFARFVKVYKFVSGFIDNIDPELIPKNQISQLSSSSTSCLSSLNNNLNSGHVSHVDSINTQIDKILSILKPYALYDKNLKRSLRESIASYIKEIDKHLSNIPDTEEEHKLAVGFREKIEKYNDELFVGDEENDAISTNIETFRTDIEEKFDEVDSFYQKLLDDDEDESIKTQILNEKTYIEENSKSAEIILKEASSKIDELKVFYIEIYGEPNEETGKLEGGLKKELKVRLQQLSEYEEGQKETYEKLIKDKNQKLKEYDIEQRNKHTKLFDHINSLIPGATSTGLALSYQTRKEEYRSTIMFWNVVFVVLVGGMMFGGYRTLEGFDSLEATFKHLLHYAPIYIPAVWLAIFASKRRSESRGFEEEYAHKEALAKSYSSYKIQIDELGTNDQELMEKLIGKSIDTVSENPSNRILNRKHGDNTPVVEILKEIKEHLPSFGTSSSGK